jgi:hypothetical protein
MRLFTSGITASPVFRRTPTIPLFGSVGWNCWEEYQNARREQPPMPLPLKRCAFGGEGSSSPHEDVFGSRRVYVADSKQSDELPEMVRTDKGCFWKKGPIRVFFCSR